MQTSLPAVLRNCATVFYNIYMFYGAYKKLRDCLMSIHFIWCVHVGLTGIRQ